MATCHSCGSEVAQGYRFCAVCGTAIPEPGPTVRLENQEPEATAGAVGATVTLTVIGKGGQEGPSFTLASMAGTQHVIGRTEGDLPFPDDNFISPRHALIYWEDDRLWVEDMGSLNGVYVRVRDWAELTDGDLFLAGEQILRFERFREENYQRAVGDTLVSGTPLRPWNFRVVQTLPDQRTGGAWVVEGAQATFGRENGAILFPYDRFMSREHCRIQTDGPTARLYDIRSRNGTYLKLSERYALSDSDYFFAGQKLFRITIR